MSKRYELLEIRLSNLWMELHTSLSILDLDDQVLWLSWKDKAHDFVKYLQALRFYIPPRSEV